MADSIEIQVKKLAERVVSLAQSQAALKVLVLARLDALESVVVQSLEQLGVQSPGQSLGAAIHKAASQLCETDLAAFSDSDPALASEIRVRLARFLDGANIPPQNL